MFRAEIRKVEEYMKSKLRSKLKTNMADHEEKLIASDEFWPEFPRSMFGAGGGSRFQAAGANNLSCHVLPPGRAVFAC